ncbi:MAG: TrmH family RNA methyltransferase [Saprospiraceae bacterium]|nr:TrmH family RNA methyltransferase [Saprospiraceae bacterium]
MMKQLEYTDYQPVQKKYPLSILLDNITTPQNVGAIFRIADTFGIEGLVMCETTPVPPHKRINSGGRGTEKTIPFTYFDDSLNAITHFRAAGYTIIALEITDESRPIRTVDFKELGKILLIAGSEETGVSQKILDVVDFSVHIPSFGICLSMNVATSVAVAAYEISGQKS